MEKRKFVVIWEFILHFSNSEGHWYDTFDNSLVDTSWHRYAFTNWYSYEQNKKDGLEDYAAIYTAFWKKSHRSCAIDAATSDFTLVRVP